MMRLWRSYVRVLEVHPWKTKMISTGTLVAAGDVLSQTLVERKTLQQYQVSRTLRYFTVGFLIIGPTFRVWYRYLDKIVTTTGKKAAVSKMLLDQGLFAPVFIVGFLAIMSYLRGESLEETKSVLKRDIKPVFITNYEIWPAVQIVNFHFVPLQHRILVINIVSLVWNTYLAYKAEEHTSNTTSKTPARLNVQHKVLAIVDTQ